MLLASLPAKDFALLAPHLKDIVLEQGAVLQEQGERIDQVYFCLLYTSPSPRDS